MLSKRDEEIKRLTMYCKSLGAKVVIKDYKTTDLGYFSHEYGKLVEINKRVHKSKLSMVLTLLHEACHLKYHIINNASLSDLLGSSDADHHHLTKKQREGIARFEIESLQLMTNIATELGITIPIKRILIAQEFDTWTYSFYLDAGKFPDTKQIKEKRKQLNEKYKGKK